MLRCTALAVVLSCSLLAQTSGQERRDADKPVDKLEPRVTLQRLPGKCRIEIDGKLFTQYLHEGWPNPVLFPVIGAAGRAMTRNFPLAEAREGEQKDHEHHRSIWFAHGEVNGHDFWAGKGRIVQEQLVGSHAKNAAFITADNRWMVGDEVICRDDRIIGFWADEHGRYIDYEVRIHASQCDLHFGDTKEGTMAMRLHPALRLTGKVAAGRVLNSEGLGGKKAWGKRARWVAYWGPIDGKVVGVALFDHPSNHGHPCRWHARDYGLVAANPWGIHHFEGAPKGTGDMVLEKGRTIRLRYRFYFFAGGAKAAGIAEQYERFKRLPSLDPRPKRVK